MFILRLTRMKLLSKLVRFLNLIFITKMGFQQMSWPSGLRRNVKAVVFIGVGSNPTDIMFLLDDRLTLTDEKFPFSFSSFGICDK